MTLDVYYESLCPDSRNFLVNQLEPNWKNMNSYTDLRLIPFGKATVIASESFFLISLIILIDDVEHLCIYSTQPTQLEDGFSNVSTVTTSAQVLIDLLVHQLKRLTIFSIYFL